jgi:hypothetical protein
MKARALTIVAALAACIAATAPALATLRDRTFVASYGNDGNPCTFGSPCKTFQGAYAATAAGGEITAIDSAGFGPLAIGHAITITSPDGVEAGIVAATGGNAITINAGSSDAVVLRGLTLNGSGTAYNGVEFNSGLSLTVSNCVVQNFVEDPTSDATTGNGILFQPAAGTSQFTIVNTIFAYNAGSGVSYIPPGSSVAVTLTGVIDHVTVMGINDSDGVAAETPVSGSTVDFVIANSKFTGNGLAISNEGGTSGVTFSIDHCEINGNTAGIIMFSPTTVLLGRSVIVGNAFGVLNDTSPTFYSYGDNAIDLNPDVNVSTALTEIGTQ